MLKAIITITNNELNIKITCITIKYLISFFSRSTIGVFVCGPSALCTDIAKHSNSHSTLHTKYAFHKETF